MKALLLKAITVVFTLAAFGAQAAVENVNPCGDIKTELLGTIAKLEAIGLTKFEGVTFQQIRESLPTMRISTVPDLRHFSDVAGTYRSSAKWDLATRSLTFSERGCSQMNKQNRPYLILHEVAGPLGLQDDSFGKTGAAAHYAFMMELKAEQPSLYKNRPALDALKEYVEAPLYAKGGGVTGVDGGGDSRILAYMRILQSTLFTMAFENEINANEYPLYLRWIGLLKIEFSAEIAQGEVLYIHKGHTLLIPDRATSSYNLDDNIKGAERFLKDVVSGRYRP